MSLCLGGGRYRHTGDLVVLSKRRPTAPLQLPSWVTSVETPLVVSEWQRLLKQHPDEVYRRYVLDGIQHGFRIGFRYGSHSCLSAKVNMRSAMENPEVVDQYLAKEVRLRRVLGPVAASMLPTASVSSFLRAWVRGYPKPHQPGKYRLILDLSRPKGRSVNDGIEPEVCSLNYASVDQAVRIITTRGRLTEMAKFDVESAYRLIPVHPDDRPLLGMKWKDQLYVEAVLPFGLRSAPKIFNAVADAMEWILREHGVKTSLHYLDDFIVFGDPGTSECQAVLDGALQLGHSSCANVWEFL